MTMEEDKMEATTASETESDHDPQESTTPETARTTMSTSTPQKQSSQNVKYLMLRARQPLVHTSHTYSEEILGFGEQRIPTSYLDIDERLKADGGARVETMPWAPMGKDNFDVMLTGLSTLPHLTLRKLKAKTTKKLAASEAAIFLQKDWEYADRVGGARGGQSGGASTGTRRA
jgi:hypothetical protein